MSPRERQAMAEVLEALDRERIKHSVLSEAFFVFTELRERLRARLEGR